MKATRLKHFAHAEDRLDEFAWPDGPVADIFMPDGTFTFATDCDILAGRYAEAHTRIAKESK